MSTSTNLSTSGNHRLTPFSPPRSWADHLRRTCHPSARAARVTYVASSVVAMRFAWKRSGPRSSNSLYTRFVSWQSILSAQKGIAGRLKRRAAVVAHAGRADRAGLAAKAPCMRQAAPAARNAKSKQHSSNANHWAPLVRANVCRNRKRKSHNSQVTRS